MIPQNAIIEWSNYVGWKTNEQVEQDLVICRALAEIFSNEFLANSLAFRGGTALHKLFLQPQSRYSEDIDLVQIRPEPIKETILILQKVLSFLGQASVMQKNSNNTLKFRFNSELPPTQVLKLKVETNCREHFTVLGFSKREFTIQSMWYNRSCQITTYKLEELLGTKLRALYQRKKGRDLYDIYKAITHTDIDIAEIVNCYRKYMTFSVQQPPTRKQFLQNIEAKIQTSAFTEDITAILSPTEKYDQYAAYEIVKKKLLQLL